MLIRRCDQCRTEATWTTQGWDNSEDKNWNEVTLPGASQLTFCTAGCITDYFVAKRMIEGVM